MRLAIDKISEISLAALPSSHVSGSCPISFEILMNKGDETKLTNWCVKLISDDDKFAEKNRGHIEHSHTTNF